MSEPFRLKLVAPCVYSDEQLLANMRANAGTRCAPRVNLADVSRRQTRKLAVCGGGPLLVHDLNTLREWDGDVWGINFTAQWLNERGVRASLFSIDPLPMEVEAPHAVLATACDPSLIEHYAGRLTLIPYEQTGGGNLSACRSLAVALYLGYLDVHLFGCEGSFEGQDHVDRHEGHESIIVIRAGGRDYSTTPGYLIQCEQLLQIITMFKDVFHNRSGGLLKAMSEHPDTWEVVGVSAAMKAHLEAVNGRQGIFERPYEPVSA